MSDRTNEHDAQVETQEAVGPPAAPPPDDRSRWRSFFEDLTGVRVDWRNALLIPILAILTALILGAVIIFATDLDLWRDFGGDSLGNTFEQIRDAYIALFNGAFGSLRAFSETLTFSAPLILAGLSVAIGFQAGLFNIGAEGQMLLGGMFGVAIGFAVDLPVLIHLPLVVVAAGVGGAIWGGIPGLLRAKTGAHEVITTIMLNAIAIRLVDYLLKTDFFQVAGRDDPVSKTVEVSARFPRLLGFMDRSDLRAHLGVVLAVVVAWFIYWLLFKSTVGFEYRAVGYNPDASEYAGMNVTWLYVSVMALAGALAGLAGAMQINGVLYRATPGFSAGIGFEAIALALLGRSHPGGVVLAGFLFGALRSGGLQMQVETAVPIDLILVVQALVVVFIAAPALIRAIYRVRGGDGAEQVVSKGWAT